MRNTHIIGTHQNRVSPYVSPYSLPLLTIPQRTPFPFSYSLHLATPRSTQKSVPSGRSQPQLHKEKSMLPVISRALTPTTRARRTFALTLALALGAVPAGTSAIASHQAVAHAAEPAAANGLIKLHQPKNDPSYAESRRQLPRHHERHPRRVGGLPRLPRQRRIHRHPPPQQRNCHPRPARTHALPYGRIPRPSRTSRKPRPTRTCPPPTPTMLRTFGQRMRASPPAGMTGSSTRTITPPATPSPRSCIVPQVAPMVPHACARFAVATCRSQED